MIDTQEVLESHPFLVANKLVERHSGLLTFEFSRYRYVRHTLEDPRETFEVKGWELTEERVRRLFSSLGADEELAIHSRVHHPVFGEMHIPMIDFVSSRQRLDLSLLASYLGKDITDELFLFDSGRSVHAYSMRLISNVEWTPFMGTLLLLNLPKKSQIVDPRWVGHRLRAGYSALRWSFNSPNYLKWPKRIPEPTGR